jgi:MFS family permease
MQSPGAASGPPPDALSLRNATGRRVLSSLAFASIQNPINSSLMVTALVPVAMEFGVGPLETSWLISGLYLASAIGQTVMGKLVDHFGARRTLLGALALTLLAAVLGVAAPSLGWLIVSRVLLGLGTAAGFPAAMVIVRRINGEKRPVPTGALSVLAIAAQASGTLGPVLSGVLVSAFGWRSTLGVNIPIGLATLAMVWWWLPHDGPCPAADRGALVARLDLPGMLLFAVGLTALMLFATPALPRLLVFGCAAAASVAFVVRELRIRQPFIDLRLIAGRPGLGRTMLRQIAMMVVQYTLFYGGAQWLEDARGAAPSMVGLLLMPMAVVAVVASGTIARRIAPRVALIIALGGAALAGLVLAAVGPGTSMLWVAAAFGVSGLLSGFGTIANQSALYAQSPPGQAGVAAGIFRTLGYGGAIVSASALGAVFGAHADDAHFHAIAYGLVVLSLTLAVLIAFDRTLPARTVAPSR